MSEEIAKKTATRRYRKVRVGVVTSNKMDKTVVVAVERQTMHRAFRKAIRLQKTVKAHDGKNEFQVGDRVQIVETRPLSKQKCWRVQKLIERRVQE